MHSQSAYPNALTPSFCIRSLAPSHSPCSIACAGPNHTASPHVPNPKENVHSPYLVSHRSALQRLASLILGLYLPLALSYGFIQPLPSVCLTSPQFSSLVASRAMT